MTTTATTPHTEVAPLRWTLDAEGRLESIALIDQRRLPAEEIWHTMTRAPEVAAGITDMIVRGAPAIGITAAFGVALAARAQVDAAPGLTVEALADGLLPVHKLMAETRPTAVNLFWALERTRALTIAPHDSAEALAQALLAEAIHIFEDDRARCLAMGEHGAALLPDGARVLTHCNTGGLATGGFGTALGVLRAQHRKGQLARVWIDETRPYLQGARLTAWECLKDGLPGVLITDNMAAHMMQRGEVDAVIVGADRIAANGDAANKIGTYGLAVLCRYHDIPFYVAAPLSTFDWSIPDGSLIPIEQRSAEEVTLVQGKRIAPEGIEAAHPAFDVTPASLITAIVTERGVYKPSALEQARDVS